MRHLIAATLLLMLATAATAQQSGNLPEPDPVFHVEVIIYAFNAGDESEEDLHHGIDTLTGGPRPRLLRLPGIELDSIFGFSPEAAGLETSEPETGIEAEDAIGTAPDGSPIQPGQPGLTPPATLPGIASDRLTFLSTTIGPPGNPEAGTQTVPAGFRPLTGEELELTRDAAALNRLGAYTVLAHAGWAVDGVDTDRSVPLDLGWMGITNPSGTIEIYLRRFLHAIVDLEFTDGSGTYWRNPETFRLAPFEYAERFRLTEERNAIRSDELHAFDHPLYGVLLRITRAPEPEESEGDEADGGPAG